MTRLQCLGCLTRTSRFLSAKAVGRLWSKSAEAKSWTLLAAAPRISQREVELISEELAYLSVCPPRLWNLRVSTLEITERNGRLFRLLVRS